MRLRHRRLRLLVALAALFVSARTRRRLFVHLLGHDIHPDARIGRSFVDVDHLVMGPASAIGPLNVIRGCERVELGHRSLIASLNWINAVRHTPEYFQGHDRSPELVLEDRAFLTYRHMIDACDRVTLEAGSCLSGFGSLVQTHSVDMQTGRQSSAPIRIGEHSLIGSRCMLLPGSVVPPTSIVAAGAVVHGDLREPAMFGGVPARRLRATDPSTPFFTHDLLDVR